MYGSVMRVSPSGPQALQQARLHACEGDLLSLMVGRADGAARAMTDEQARDELLTLLIAGAETTATTLSWALRALSTDPRAQARIGAEARSVGLAADPAAAAPYTDRFLTEVLRLYQPNWFMMRRTTRPTRPTAIRSVPLPEGAELILSAAALHRDPAAFPDPLRFDPDRALAGPPAPPASCPRRRACADPSLPLRVMPRNDR
ncbi:cytochrome P450 [Streptomyces sp. NPDC003710]